MPNKLEGKPKLNKQAYWRKLSKDCPWRDHNLDCRAQSINTGQTDDYETCYMNGCALFYFAWKLKELEKSK